MKIRSIVAYLVEERDRLDKAIQALQGIKSAGLGIGRRRGVRGRFGQSKRKLSAEARRRISEAQKQRWARQKRKKAR